MANLRRCVHVAGKRRPSIKEALKEGRSVHHTIKWEVGMTRTDVMASSRPREADTAANGERPGRPLRRLAGIPAVLLITMALVVPTAAFAAGEATSGYEQKPPPPTTTTTSTTPPPASTTPPTTSTPTTETSPTK